MTYRSPGAVLAALRKKHKHKCQQCGQTFDAVATARYCSNACRQKAKRARKPE